MDDQKTIGMSFRVTPRFKRLLQAAATRERRSLTNMIEMLVEDYCSHHGIGRPGVRKTVPHFGE